MVIPLAIDLETWAANLYIDFPLDDIPILIEPEHWQDWADQLIQSTTFSEAGSPGAEGFEDWQSWAFAVYNTVVSFVPS